MLDIINASFELLAAIVLALNVRQIRRDKRVSGVHWFPVVVFTLWGIWNLFYYPSLDQWLSGAAAGFVAVMNSLWLFYAWRYRKDRV